MRTWITAGILFLSVRCVPLPHFANLTPLLDGRIEKDGAPAANVRVRALPGLPKRDCEGRHVETTTNADGTFALRPIRDVDLFVVVLPAHKMWTWQLCLDDGTGWRPVLQPNDYTLSDSGPWWISSLRCDLGRSPVCDETQELDYSRERVGEVWRRGGPQPLKSPPHGH